MSKSESVESIQLIVAKEREINGLRLKLNRLRNWLTVVDRCVAAAEEDAGVEQLYQAWAEGLVSEVHFTVAVVFRVDDDQLALVARAGRRVAPVVVSDFDPEVLRQQAWGRIRDDEQLPFAPSISIRKAIWACFEEWEGQPIVLLAGFDPRAARFVDNPDDDTIDHLRMTAQNLGAFASRVGTTEALRREHGALFHLNAELQARDSMLRNRNELLSRRTEDLQDALDQLKRAHAELVHRERLGAVGQIAAGVAHEVNNPATFVLANLEELVELLSHRDRAPDQVHASRLATEALEGLHHIVGIIRELGMFARAGTDSAQDLTVAEYVGIVARLTTSHARHRAELTFARQLPDALIRGSRRQLSQVFVNLVMNALEAMPPGRPAALNRVDVSVEVAGDKVRFVVSDNGSGVCPKVRPHIYEPFFTTKDAQGGSGLGLSIARDIIHEHGGVLSFEESDGGGARFSVTLPRVLGASSVLTSVEPQHVGQRVLLVDDDPRILRVHQRKLEQTFKVETALGADEGLQALTREPLYDAVLCDLMMPHMNGYELWQRVTEADPRYRSRFIFLTGGIARADLRVSIEEGGFLVSRKPISVAEIEDMVGRVVSSPRT